MTWASVFLLALFNQIGLLAMVAVNLLKLIVELILRSRIYDRLKNQNESVVNTGSPAY